MFKILISLFNSLFFFALFQLIVQNWVVAGIVAGVVLLITLFALSLATMAHNSSTVPDIRDQPLRSSQKSYQFISQGARSREYSMVSTPTKNPNKITGRKETAYMKNN